MIHFFTYEVITGVIAIEAVESTDRAAMYKAAGWRKASAAEYVAAWSLKDAAALARMRPKAKAVGR